MNYFHSFLDLQEEISSLEVQDADSRVSFEENQDKVLSCIETLIETYQITHENLQKLKVRKKFKKQPVTQNSKCFFVC